MQLSSTPPPAAAPLPHHGVKTVAEVVNRADELAGGVVSVWGTYIHSTGSIYDDSSIATSVVPGPIAGAAALKVQGLSDDFIASLDQDHAAGTGERWGRVHIGGVVDANNGVTTLRVRDASLVPSPWYEDDDAVGTIGG